MHDCQCVGASGLDYILLQEPRCNSEHLSRFMGLVSHAVSKVVYNEMQWWTFFEVHGIRRPCVGTYGSHCWSKWQSSRFCVISLVYSLGLWFISAIQTLHRETFLWTWIKHALGKELVLVLRINWMWDWGLTIKRNECGLNGYRDLPYPSSWALFIRHPSQKTNKSPFGCTEPLASSEDIQYRSINSINISLLQESMGNMYGDEK